MENNAPVAQPNGPHVPAVAAPPPAPDRAIPPPAPVSGAAHQPTAPPPRRSRQPRGLFTTVPSTGPSSAPALLELAASHPMYTEQRRSPNIFVPDAQMLFHTLSYCDTQMTSTERFTRSSPAWLPIVSQLYVAVLWHVMILRVYVNSGYGIQCAQLLEEMVHHLRIDECLIPGPLVPFFQSLGAVNGPFEWIGDVLPGLPDFQALWDSATFSPHASFARQLPIPAIMLDQLAHFAMRVNAANAGDTTSYAAFEWYRNVFSVGVTAYDIRLRIGPQTCGSLYCTESQFAAAKSFWTPVFADFARINAAAGQAVLSSYAQLFGFQSQAGATQLNWFAYACTCMQKYCQFFNGSVPLKSIPPVGIGAVVVRGLPYANAPTRDWLYPAVATYTAFRSSRFTPLREMPDNLTIKFEHADHELEEVAEQYAIISHTNIDWSSIATQNAWTAINGAATHVGSYWQMPSFRFSSPVRFKTQYAQLIASRYHQQNANRAE